MEIGVFGKSKFGECIYSMGRKFWRRHEKEVMKDMGLAPVRGSGNTWLAKEDGESEDFLAQLKSTKKESISLKLEDVKKLFEHAASVNKKPVFVLDFVHNKFPVKLVAFDYYDVMDIFNGE